MVVVNNMLNEVAKAINNESFVIPSHLAVGTGTVSSFLTTDTSVYGEIGTREEFSGSRIDNTITLTGVRSGTDVADTTNGDTLTNSGIYSASSGGTFLTGATHSGIIQTTNFDLEFIYTYTIERK
jgi:hypothetical protein